MKSKKTKKILGGVAIAAVSLGCLGLAGIANAAVTTTGNTGSSTTATSDAYQLGSQTGAMTGNQTITVSTSKAQGETLSDHNLEYIKIGNYLGHGTTFTTQAASQDVENELYDFATASNGGLKTAFPDASYAASDGEALNWMLTQNNGGTFLGADASGQAGYGTSGNMDYAVRLLANWLYTNIGSLGATPTKITLGSLSDTNGYQTGTFTVDSPGIYLIVDTSNVNQSLPILLSTMPESGYTVPQMMKDFVTNQIALKTQDPQATPMKQFVSDATYPTTSGADFTDTGSLTGTMSSTIGSANLVTYQVSNVFPNTNGYPTYTYNFIDYPGMGLTLNIQGGENMYVAGIPISTLVSKGTMISETMNGKTNMYGTGEGALSSMTDLVGAANNGAELKVSLNEASMQYIQANGYQTSNVDGKKINFAKFSSNTTPAQAVNGSTNTMEGGANKGASSYTGQTVAAASGENGNTASDTATQATGELFGLTYQGYLNQGASTTMSDAMPTTGAYNTAETQNNGSSPMTSSQLPLTTSGGYNGTTTNGSGKKQGTTQVNPTNTTHSQDGVPTKTTAGAGISWMKIWGSGSVATGAAFYVTRPSTAPGNTSGQTQYLYATGSGWGWTTNKRNAQMIEAATLYNGTGDSAVNPKAEGGLFEIAGLASGVTYTVTEAVAATGADPNVLPSFNVMLNSDGTETVTSTSGSLNLVNNTPNGNPFNSNMYNTVENVKSLSGLPLTGGAGILTGVIAAVILFGTAGIVLVVYKRRKQQKD